jgi:hypothetical protein
MAEAARAPLKPLFVELTFHLGGIASDADVAAVQRAIEAVPTVRSVTHLTPVSGHANVHWDQHAVSHHVIAERIRESLPKVRVSSRFRVPAYAQHRAEVDAVFARYARHVTIATLDAERGHFEILYHPLALDAEGGTRQGFVLGGLYHALVDPAPRGLALEFNTIDEDGLAGVPASWKRPKA